MTKNKFSLVWTIIFLFFFSLISYGLFSLPNVNSDFLLPDEVSHFMAFLILTYTIYKSMESINWIFPILLYGLISEIIQFYLPYRDFQLNDLFFNFFGILSAIFVIFFLKKLEKPN